MNAHVRTAAVAALLLATACGEDAVKVGRALRARMDSSRTSSTTRPRATKGSDVGLNYEALPSRFTYRGGSVLPSASGVGYDLAHVTTTRGDAVWLEQLGGGQQHTVVAALQIPTLAKGEQVVLGSCDVNGQLDPTIVAITDSGTSRLAAHKAWRANVDVPSFESIPVRGITCEDVGT